MNLGNLSKLAQNSALMKQNALLQVNGARVLEKCFEKKCPNHPKLVIPDTATECPKCGWAPGMPIGFQPKIFEPKYHQHNAHAKPTKSQFTSEKTVSFLPYISLFNAHSVSPTKLLERNTDSQDVSTFISSLIC